MADETPTVRREPIFNIPGVVALVCVLLLGIHAWRQFIAIETDNWVVAEFAFIPARVSIALHLFSDRLTAAFHAAADQSPVIASQIEFLIGDGQSRWWTLLTYAFLHGSWAHVGFNCVWLVAFGSAVARRFGSARFLVLLAISAVAGALVQYVASVANFQIVIGASAAVAGAMGAAVRFVFQPSDRAVRVFDRSSVDEAFRLPALSLRETFTTKATLAFVVFWFLSNILFGLVPALGGIGDAPVAWQAHIGGFVVGLLLFPLFDPKRPRPSSIDVDPAESAAVVETGSAGSA